MLQIENVFFQVANNLDRNVLVICDRGAMDASAFIERDQWEEILRKNSWNEIDLRDNRYNHVVHMVSCAYGAESFYSLQDHSCRSEDLDLARDLDQKAAQAWVGHPYFDVIDNSTDFEMKLNRMIQSVCQRLGIDAQDRFKANSRKLKFLIKGPVPSADEFPTGFQDFYVVHDYLQANDPNMQMRLRKRGQGSHWSFTYTVRRPEHKGQSVEVKTTLTQRDYNNLLLSQRDVNHTTILKTRRCFIYENQYFQMDIYNEPCPPRCAGLVLLETYSALSSEDLKKKLPPWLDVIKEVTGDPCYSMFNLSLKDNWRNNQYFSGNSAASCGRNLNDTQGKAPSRTRTISNCSCENMIENERNSVSFSDNEMTTTAESSKNG